MNDFVYARDPTVQSLARPVRALSRKIPFDVALMIAMFVPRDRNCRAATSALITSLVFTEDHWDPEGLCVYSRFGDSLRIPVAHQPWRIEVVYDHVFRFQATCRERDEAWFRLVGREGRQ